jgi:hypothetical protein
MELDFDKEMDAILRQTARSGEFASANSAEAHLDADEISAFAENALPEKTRTVYVSHLADCDRCRTILSNLILLNSESEVETASAAAAPVVVETKIPWHRRIFAVQNLAYTLGGLVILFGGFIGFLVFQSAQNYQTEVSQISDNEPAASGPNIGSGETFANSNAASAVNMSNMTSTNTAANTSIAMSNTAMMNANVSIAPAKPALAAPTPETLGKENREETKQLAEQQVQIQPQPRILRKSAI